MSAAIDLRAEQAAHREREDARTLQRRAERVLQVAGHRASDEEIRTAAGEVYERHPRDTQLDIAREAIRLRDGLPALAWVPTVTTAPAPASESPASIEVEKQEVAPAARPAGAPKTQAENRTRPATTAGQKKATPAQREEIRAFLRTFRAEHPEAASAEGQREVEARFGLRVSQQTFNPTYWHRAAPEGVTLASARKPKAPAKKPAAEKPASAAAGTRKIAEDYSENIPAAPQPTAEAQVAAPPAAAPPTATPARAPIQVTSQDGERFRVELHLVLELEGGIALSLVLNALRGAKEVEG